MRTFVIHYAAVVPDPYITYELEESSVGFDIEDDNTVNMIMELLTLFYNYVEENKFIQFHVINVEEVPYEGDE